MGRKHAAPPPAAQTYRSSPLLMKPGKRSRQEALPSALHMGICVTLSLLVFAIINICVTESLGPKNPWTKLVQSGTMMAMITVTVLGTPNLGNSFTKAFQRIVGVMIGGWLFYGLYAACQQWWFLVICLSIWGFVLVALSFWLSGREFLFPVALVTAFIVVCNFNSVRQALVMTMVKTVAFAGAIVVYTVLSLLMFPLTATQQLLTNLALALRDLEELADIVLVNGDGSSQQSAAETPTDLKDVEAQAAADTASSAAVPDSKQANGAAPKSATAKQVAAQASLAVRLAADANHKLQTVQQLLRMTKKERYIGTIGSYRCFLPTVLLKAGKLPEQEVLAVVVNASQVLRVLVTLMSDFGNLPLARRLPPIKLGSEGAQHVLPLAQHAVAALQDISAGLPVSGNSSFPVPIGNIQGISVKLQDLVADTVNYRSSSPDLPSAEAPARNSAAQGGDARAARNDSSATGAAARWQKAAVAAGGIQLPGTRSQQIAAAFSDLLTSSVTSEEGQLARWCSVLVMSRQLGRAIAGLNDSLNEMLVKLPWLDAGTVL